MFNTSVWGGCDLRLLSTPVEQVDWGFPFHIQVPQGVINNLTSGLIQMLDSGALSDTRDTWFIFKNDPCKNRDPKASSTGTLEFRNFSGLWIILGATVSVNGS